MLLSEFLKSPTKNAYGLIVDEPSFDLPDGTTEVSFVYQFGDDGKISVDLLDTMIAYKLYGAKIILEIPFEAKVVPPEIVVTAANLEISLSLLPPASTESEDWDRYSTLLVEYANLWFKIPSTHLEVQPVTAFFQYLAQCELGYVQQQVSSDDYLEATFTSKFSLEQLDASKQYLQSEIYRYFGGREKFAEFVSSHVVALTRPLPSFAELTKFHEDASCK